MKNVDTNYFKERRCNLNKTKRQPIEWEKIYANKVTKKGLISKTYKHLTQLNIRKKKKKPPIKNCVEDLNRRFPKKSYTWTKGK